MKYDVFISYSRKDPEIANELCKALDEARVSYWIDRSKVHGSANFLTEITRCIKSCKVVIFIATANSVASEWTQKEILFAIKHKKSIIPYRIGAFSFEDNDELDFVFTNVQWVEDISAVISSLNELGIVSQQEITEATVSTSTHLPMPESQPSKVYKVGDYYDENGKEGVVFDVCDEGRHGKIVSVKQSSEELKWITDTNEERLIGANNVHNGAYNMSVVKQIDGWRSKYPAFAWCADLGEGWYLPAKEELLTLYSNKDAVNNSLRAINAAELNWYLSSTESNEFRAWLVFMTNGIIFNCPKSFSSCVRAVSAF